MTMFTEARPVAVTRPAFRFSPGRALAVWRQRQQLRSLDASALADLGLSYREATAEARRPIWDVPGYWQK
jgi:uncharacterized protein YjiS (DUF1127 family)